MQRQSLPAHSPISLRSGASSSKNVAPAVLKLLGYLGCALLFLIIAVSMQSTTGIRFVASAFIFLLLFVLIVRAPMWGAILTLSFLVIVGGLRRWLIPDFGWPSLDPLVLIGPAIALLCFLGLMISRTVPSDTPVSKFVKYLLVIMAIEVFNPLQGGLLVGFGGILYYMAPLLWFYVGRVYGNLNISLTLSKTAIVAYSLTALYGLKQVFFGLSSSEQEWMKVGGYMALNVSANAIRVFSTYASQQEFAISLSFAICICAAFIIHKKYQYVFPLVILVPALLYTAARGPIAYGLCAICIQWALMGRSRSVWLPRLGLALFIGVAGIGWSLSSIDTTKLAAGQADILRHQKDGLLNPGESTAPQHLMLVGQGVLYGVTHPLGVGLGSTTLAAGKLSGGAAIEGFTAETDHGNLFVSLGVVGGTIYVILTFLIFKETVTLWSQSRNIVFLILVGVLVNSLGQWLSGGLYSLCFITWFCIGCMDKQFSLIVKPENNSENILTRKSSRIGRRQSVSQRNRPVPRSRTRRSGRLI